MSNIIYENQTNNRFFFENRNVERATQLEILQRELTVEDSFSELQQLEPSQLQAVLAEFMPQYLAGETY
jgi:hypothetical protein